jgi:COP9 signalosome complex subunit 3
VKLLAAALLRIDPTGSILTSHHLPLVKMAYETDNIETVVELISKNIVYYPGMKGNYDTHYICDMSVPPAVYMTPESGITSKLTTSAVLEYDLLCGLCHLSRRSFQAACDAFERVLTFPTKDLGCSKMMVDAYSRWVLVNLLLHGKAPSLPPTTGQGAQRTYHIAGRPYVAVAKAFEKVDGGAEALKAEFEAGGSFWQEEGNLGLMREVLIHYQRWQILNLRDVYSKTSIEHVRERTRSAETGKPLESAAAAESLIRSMIAEGMLAGEIEKPAGAVDGDGKGFLTFLPAAEELSEAQFAAGLLVSARNIKSLDPVLKFTNDRLATSRDYVKHLVKEQRREREGTRDPALGFETQIEDEDLMAGVLAGH